MTTTHLPRTGARRAAIRFTALALLGVLVRPAAATPTCADDTCTGAASTLFAIAHSYTDPSGTILYRVTVPAWSPGTAWGDGHNGFFYETVLTDSNGSESVRTYVPFNGVGIGSDDAPQLPGFTFIVSAPTTTAAITVSGCSTDYAANTSVDPPTAPCTKSHWSDEYDALPTPSAGCPPSGLDGVQLRSLDPSALSIAFNGVYGAVATLDVDTGTTTLDDDSITWLFDHLLFLDDDGNPYTNDLFDTDLQSLSHRSLGVLALSDAGYQDPTTGTWSTKYGTVGGQVQTADPNRQFVFFSADGISTASITAGVDLLYDLSDDCPGYLDGIGNGDGCVSTCASAVPALGIPLRSGLGTALAGDLGYTVTVTVSQSEDAVGGTIVAGIQDGATAGEEELRTLAFTAESSGSGTCSSVTNPLAINESGTAYNLPNYVIDDSLASSAWDQTFGVGAYYVGATGFGPCSGSLPFCERASGYEAYVPHYLDTNQSGGSLGGGSTTAATVGGAVLSDEYAVGTLGDTATNTLVWFDDCGYGYAYSENVTTGERQALPDPPSDWSTRAYTVTNGLSSPVVFGKTCCASYYQENSTTNALEPPQQINDSYGVFVPPTSNLSYETLFGGELMTIYDAFSGAQMARLWLDPDTSDGPTGTLYGCSDALTQVGLTDDAGTVTIALGGSGDTTLTCTTLGACPPGMTEGTDGDSTTCTATSSSFLVGLDDWADAVSSDVDTVQIRAWGAAGHSTTQSDGIGDDTVVPGGAGGFALTLRAPSDLPAALYAYVAPSGYSTGTVLIDQPLSLLTDDAAKDVEEPDTVGTWLVAGGGGAAGVGYSFDGGDGGAGGCAAATADSLTAVSAAGSSGGTTNNGGDETAEGGNDDSSMPGAGGTAATGGGDGAGGLGGWGHDAWDQTGGLLPPQSWSAGNGGKNPYSGTYSHGGGGFGGGGSGGGDADGTDDASGGAGGGSWASANTVTDSTAPDCDSAPSSPASDAGAVQLAYTPLSSDLYLGTDDTIRRVRHDGTRLTTVAERVSLAALVADAAHRALYWTDVTAGQLVRAALDGTSATPLVTGISPVGHALVLHAGTLYYLDGTLDAETITAVDVATGARTALCTLSGATDLAVDGPADNLYWSDAEGVRRVSLSGVHARCRRGADTVLDLGSRSDAEITAITIDATNGYLWAATRGLADGLLSVQRSELNGAAAMVVASPTASGDTASGGVRGLDVSPALDLFMGAVGDTVVTGAVGGTLQTVATESAAVADVAFAVSETTRMRGTARCASQTGFAAVRCLATSLVSSAHARVDEGVLHDKLVRLLRRAQAHLGEGVALRSDTGSATRRLVRSALRDVRHTRRLLRSRRVKRALDASVRGALLHDLTTLRDALRALRRRRSAV